MLVWCGMMVWYMCMYEVWYMCMYAGMVWYDGTVYVYV